MVNLLANESRNSRFRQQNPKVSSQVAALDIAAKKLISRIDSGYSERQLLSTKDSRIQDIINSELELSKGVSGGNIIDFIVSMSKDAATRNGTNPEDVDTYNLFTEDVGNIFGYFQEMYKNRYIELSDLRFITKFIPAIGEAVKTTLDSIVSADDFSTSISRNLEFGAGLTDDERIQVESEIHRIEDDEKLLKKLRNVVYKKALVSGNHYVYCIPYAELFSEYDRLVKEGRIRDNMLVNQAIARGQMRNAKAGFNIKSQDKDFTAKYAGESGVMGIDVGDDGMDPAISSIIFAALEEASAVPFIDPKDDRKGSEEAKKAFKEDLINAFEQCYMVDSEVLVEALEGVIEADHASEAIGSSDMVRRNLGAYRETFAGNGVIDEKIFTPDGTANLNRALYGKPEKFKTAGSYIKYIDANSIVPVKVFNQIIGYFHVHDMTAKKKASAIQSGIMQTNVLASTSNVFSSITVPDDSRQRATQAIVNAVCDGILTNFSSKFVNKNADFKRLIGDCIVANGFVNTAFQIQFIPAKYIVSFSVNEDEDGMGQSILQDALFPAKMLLSTIVSKLLLYMNKSGSRTIAYVRRGPIDRTGSNQIQRVIRMIQESNITFSDLLSTNLSFSKFSRYGNLQIPMSRNGDRLIDFETQEGQDVDMHTPMEEYLEKLAIIGTGVPSVIMEYTDAADYAKSIVTANIKFAGRVATLQADLEDPTTDLYRMLIQSSTLDDELKKKALLGFRFKLCRPRVLTNINMSDYLSQMDQITRAIASMFLGDQDQGPDDEKLRRKFVQILAGELLPFIKWEDYVEMLNRARVEIAKEKDLDKQTDTGDDNLGDEF